MWRLSPLKPLPSPQDDCGMFACRRGAEPLEEVLQGLFLNCPWWLWAVWCRDSDTRAWYPVAYKHRGASVGAGLKGEQEKNRAVAVL